MKAAGIIPKTTEKSRAALDRGRAIWLSPEFAAIKSAVASRTAKKTNARRVWDQNRREVASRRLSEQWASGKRRFPGRVGKYRSSLERDFAADLEASGIEYEYESKRFPVNFDGKTCTYTPDFYLPATGWHIEIKGFWWDDAKRKVVAFIEQYPDLSFTVLQGRTAKELKVILGRPWKPAV
ncbi:MAG: hypothetical protein ACRDQZ_10365 [Mycobacteriales bacterium]